MVNVNNFTLHVSSDEKTLIIFNLIWHQTWHVLSLRSIKCEPEVQESVNGCIWIFTALNCQRKVFS